MRSLEGRMSSRIESTKGKNSSTQLILLKKPAYLRLDALTPFGQPALTVSTDGIMVYLYHHTERRYFAGMANSHRLLNILPSTLSLADLTLILSGGIPVIDFDPSMSSVDVIGNRYRLTLRNGDKREEILYSSTTLELEGTTIYGPGDEVIVSVTMDKFKAYDSVKIPTAIKTVLPQEHYILDIRYSDLIINSIEETDFFNLEPPDGISVENLSGHML